MNKRQLENLICGIPSLKTYYRYRLVQKVDEKIMGEIFYKVRNEIRDVVLCKVKWEIKSEMNQYFGS